LIKAIRGTVSLLIGEHVEAVAEINAPGEAAELLLSPAIYNFLRKAK